MRILNIGIAASSEDSNKRVAQRFVSNLNREVRLFLGGYWGLMRDVEDAASERGITVVFLLPLNPKVSPPRRPEFIAIDTGMEYRARSVLICRSSDVLVTLGGEAGTIIEAYMGYAMGKPVVVLINTGHSSDKLELMGEQLDNRGTSKLYYTKNPSNAAKLALALAKEPTSRSQSHTHG
ncbi:hypothetical protein B9Q04_08665 [Candidatus Marsarchaeota G2 archaeon BE_D]|jgi:Predicted Rossmann fold nucleotide-binding protein|uniref:LOG family protein n=1 Tax=Candidatus Marsarchaeota G2 archaeon BE_D TaxID=1978158 RepID=A0A2R6CAB8_9ARCH|nr:MAG: hypothetical protein B9Q04_08665 [Candidatus Marsarchaeota G2 archaeon BE_D]